MTTTAGDQINGALRLIGQVGLPGRIERGQVTRQKSKGGHQRWQMGLLQRTLEALTGKGKIGPLISHGIPSSGGGRRPATSLGREVRAATASFATDASGRNLDPNKLNPAKVALGEKKRQRGNGFGVK